MKPWRGWMGAAAVVLAAGVLAGTGARPAAQTPPRGQAPLPAPPTQGPPRQYTGAPIDVDFQGADLRTVIRYLADVGGLNLVIDPSVPQAGRVDIKLTRVPWDQVLEVVLRNHQLDYEVEGTVVRIVSAEAMQKAYEARQRLAEARAEALARESVRSQVFALNYAKSGDLDKILRSSILSKYGDTRFDERTNTLIVTDIPERLQATAELIKQLDQPEPQVEIEARIVQTNREAARALGIQWGVSGRVAQDLGNTTPLAFPNNGSLTGRVAGQAVTPGTAVNLPVTGATSALGLSMGAINGSFNLDVALTALERDGRGRILSAPRVTTQNNKLAEVTQGFEIPFQTQANQTTTVQFKDAALKLTVTPQITSAQTVILRIELENGFPDFSRSVNNNPSIVTQRASTQVLVADGVTTVIGGILSSTESSRSSQTPGAGRIPLFGWLFRSNETSSDSQELLIFITPRIIQS